MPHNQDFCQAELPYMCPIDKQPANSHSMVQISNQLVKFPN